MVYIDGEKYSLADSRLLPTVAVLDWTLTSSLPAGITAATGLNALCQLIESMWSVAANEDSMRDAEAALKLAIEHLPTAVNAPSPEARRGMSRAAYLAGRAINQTKTTAPHALPYTLTKHHDVPHGFAVALTLPTLFRYNAKVEDDNCNDPRGAAAVRGRIDRIVRTIGCDSVDDAVSRFHECVRQIGAPSELSDVGVASESAMRSIAESVNQQRLRNNPRSIDTQQIVQLLQA